MNLHGTHVSNSRVATAKTKRCPVQGQENAKQPIAFSIDELFSDNTIKLMGYKKSVPINLFPNVPEWTKF